MAQASGMAGGEADSRESNPARAASRDKDDKAVAEVALDPVRNACPCVPAYGHARAVTGKSG